MSSFIASSLSVLLHMVGFAIGCVIWLTVGWCLGTAFSHAPISGALTGLAWQLGCYTLQHEAMWASIEQTQEKLLLAFQRESV